MALSARSAVLETSSQPKRTLLHYEYDPETTAELEWANLSALDMSLFDKPGGKEKLAADLKNAIENIGFFYIINFGLPQEEIDNQFALARDFFNLPLSEKLKFEANLTTDGYCGYRPAGNRELVAGVFDNVEVYGFPKFIPEYARRHPAIIEEHLDEVAKFSRFLHEEVGQKLLVLIAMVLELPEDYLQQRHRYDAKSECNLRYLKYNKRTPEETRKLGSMPSVRGHTDFGSITMLFRQPIAGLQVLTPEGEWRYVKPHPGSITVNIADMLDFISNGYLKSSIHRVVGPPSDQAHLDRIGVVYFMRPEDDVELKVVDSPVLKGRNHQSRLGTAEGVTAAEWVKSRTQANAKMNASYLKKEEDLVKGMKAKLYT